MTPQEISEKWISKDGEIRPVNFIKESVNWPISKVKEALEIHSQRHTYPCPTLADGEYDGDDLDWRHQIQHTRGWGDLRDEEVELYTNSNATTRITICLKQPPAIDAENIDLSGLTINEAYLHGVISGQKKRIEQLESALKGYVKVEDVIDVLQIRIKECYEVNGPLYCMDLLNSTINQIKQLSK